MLFHCFMYKLYISICWQCFMSAWAWILYYMRSFSSIFLYFLLVRLAPDWTRWIWPALVKHWGWSHHIETHTQTRSLVLQTIVWVHIHIAVWRLLELNQLIWKLEPKSVTWCLALCGYFLKIFLLFLRKTFVAVHHLSKTSMRLYTCFRRQLAKHYNRLSQIKWISFKHMYVWL